jgi:hypothetical protein
VIPTGDHSVHRKRNPTHSRATRCFELSDAKLDLLLKHAGIEYNPYTNLPPSVIDALKRGKKIEAIKRYRDATSVGLKEANLRVALAQAPGLNCGRTLASPKNTARVDLRRAADKRDWVEEGLQRGVRTVSLSDCIEVQLEFIKSPACLEHLCIRMPRQ